MSLLPFSCNFDNLLSLLNSGILPNLKKLTNKSLDIYKHMFNVILTNSQYNSKSLHLSLYGIRVFWSIFASYNNDFCFCLHYGQHERQLHHSKHCSGLYYNQCISGSTQIREEDHPIINELLCLASPSRGASPQLWAHSLHGRDNNS